MFAPRLPLWGSIGRASKTWSSTTASPLFTSRPIALPAATPLRRIHTRPPQSRSPATSSSISRTQIQSQLPTPLPPPQPQNQQRRPYHLSPSNKHSAVDPSEISHFTTLASSWWDPYGPSRLLHLMNPLRHDFIARCQQQQRQQAQQPQSTASPTSPSTPVDETKSGSGIKLLDIGCGGGIFAESAARLPSVAHVTGLDPTPAVLQVARAHAMQEDPFVADKLTYVLNDVEGFAASFSRHQGSSRTKAPAGAGTPTGEAGGAGAGTTTTTTIKNNPPPYDIITVFEVLEHLPSPSSFLDTCLSLLTPGGLLVGSTIARTWTSWFTTKLIAEDIVGIVPRGTHEWGKYINPGEIEGYVRHPDREGVKGIGGAHEKAWDADSLLFMGVVYVPGLGWKEVKGSEKVGNYFFGVRKGV
ncbi:ubiquinone biosynthesis O-methyltransferase [Zalerion maritima]|uniref:Ubiquinone biosynthesis O-methyltransferase, mitochondrial n=1 Tax=Zalerion maritima TaxID=339359 RepID=A0AAD5RQ12_9PEZI|nr:ubiquinone biosynthesis O-methyltransferase [Zalerion maritima]